MKTSHTIRTIIRTLTGILFTAQVFAQSVPQVSIPAANLMTTSISKGYSFSEAGKKAGIVNTGTGTITFTGTINFKNNDTLYIGENVIFNPDFINGFSSGCMIINGGTANLDNCAFTGGQVDNYGDMAAGYLGVTNFTLNNYAVFNMANGCSLNASLISNYGTLTTGYLGMTGDPSVVQNNAGGNMTITSSGRVAVAGSSLRNDGSLCINNFLTSDSGTTVINKGRINVRMDFNIGGTVANKGMMITGGKMNATATAILFNSCRMVTGQFSNAAVKLGNYGILWVLEDTYGAFSNSGTVKNAGYIRTTQFINNASGVIINALSNTYTNGYYQEGAIRIEGGSGAFESMNFGAVSGGKICDAANQSYVLDTIGTNMTAVMTMIAAYDTATYQNAPMLSCNCAAIGQVNDTTATVQLTGEKLPGYNQLNWQISNTGGLVSAELQMATNEQDYTQLQFTNITYAQQNATYAYQDAQPGVVNYYRLKLTDTSGNVTFSNVVTLGVQWAAGIENTTTPVATATVSCYPNPFTDNINVNMDGTAYETVRVQLLDLSGRVVTAVDYNAHTGANNFNVSGLQNLVPGIYVLQLYTEKTNQQFQYKIVKQ